jgi:hypothetical protein
MGSREVPYDKDKECDVCGKLGANDFMGDYLCNDCVTYTVTEPAHVKEVERLQKELDELNKLKLVDQHGELLLECRIGDEYHQLLLEAGLNTILEKFIKEEKRGILK